MRTRPMLLLALLLAAGTLTGCRTRWRLIERHEGWTLHAEDPAAVDVTAFRNAYHPAREAVERALGPFRRNVRVHVWRAEADRELGDVSAGQVQEVPGIGQTRVRAYHTRSDGLFGPPSGIYDGTADPGTAVHELVHARLAEERPDMPLWLEEGIANLLGDGFLDGQTWVVDGLACWPLRELRAQQLSDEELTHVLALRAEDGNDARGNVLAHFVGWAIVFDLYRESGRVDWREWVAGVGRGITLTEARARMARTLSEETERAWLERLASPDRAVRLAAAKGLWKLRTQSSVEALIAQLEREEDGEVSVALAVNALAAAGERQLPGRLNGRLWRAVWPALRRGSLADEGEARALRELSSSFRWRSNSSADASAALEGLRRFWAE